jgi:hypothetical protein
MTERNAKDLISALVAVAKSMGAEAETIKRIRDAVNRPDKETWLTTKQVMERTGLCQKTVLEIKDKLGVVKRSSRQFRYPMSKILEWEAAGGRVDDEPVAEN